MYTYTQQHYIYIDQQKGLTTHSITSSTPSLTMDTTVNIDGDNKKDVKNNTIQCNEIYTQQQKRKSEY